ncbi:hypothetical protein AYI68_g8206 [Smittium mucronatum]|uniref:Uncharacterized protein n=1 Tax=Smittium mucronatum TaxID=133383 RepID=A0A1R0GLJ4_9FUNG|nr:hypothetical protein AYI68_g8206 [Smittium mucronatum]
MTPSPKEFSNYHQLGFIEIRKLVIYVSAVRCRYEPSLDGPEGPFAFSRCPRGQFLGQGTAEEDSSSFLFRLFFGPPSTGGF